MLVVLYMIPFEVWGLNIFHHGQLNECNDGEVATFDKCVDDFSNSVVGDDGAFAFLAPRYWDNPSPSTTFSFDNSHSSLLILFKIVSLEGWVGAMNVATSALGPTSQLQTNSAEVKPLFFMIYIRCA